MNRDPNRTKQAASSPETIESIDQKRRRTLLAGVGAGLTLVTVGGTLKTAATRLAEANQNEGLHEPAELFNTGGNGVATFGAGVTLLGTAAGLADSGTKGIGRRVVTTALLAGATVPAGTAAGNFLAETFVDSARERKRFMQRHYPLESSVVYGGPEHKSQTSDPAAAESKPAMPPITPAPPQDKPETSYRDLERSRDRVDLRTR